MSAASASTRLRERGNQYYGRAAATGHGEDKLSLLHVAQSLYEESLQMASTADEKASTHKNLGATLVQLAGLSSTTVSKRQLLLQSVHHKCQAYVTGPAAHKSEAWLEIAWEGIDTSIDLLLEELGALLQSNAASNNMGQVLQQLAELHAVIPEEICEWRMYSSRDLLKCVRIVAAQLITPPGADDDAGHGLRGRTAAAAAAAAEADWKGCLRLLAEANRPLIEALQLALDFEDGDVVTELLTLEDELYVMECRACSTQARLQGEQLMQSTLRQRRDRLDRQAAAAAAQQQQQQQQQHSDTSQQNSRDQSRPAAAGGAADANAGAAGAAASRVYKKAKRQQKRLSQQQQQQSGNNAQTAALNAEEAAAAEACERDGLMSALDLLKSAALLARERDLQAEAQALSSLGHLYKVCAAILDPILVPHKAAAAAAAAAPDASADGTPTSVDADGDAADTAAGADSLLARSAEERSRDAFLRVLLLVDALPNKISLMMEDWYREARDSISAYQASRAAAEEQQREAERAPVREALRDELQALYDAANRGWMDLLKHCYDKHPPLSPANRLPPDTVFDADHGKELLRRAILAYHPDKQGVAAAAAAGAAFSWQVMAEEITKQLTLKYECFK